MPRHRETRRLPWNAEQLYGLVADVARYPEFIPWCTAARIRYREGDVFWADLVIGFRFIRERFTSKVTLEPCREINVAYARGPFRRMSNRWRFVAQADGSCLVDFDIDFEFRSAVLQRTLGLLFHEAVRRMVGAFEARARQLYGPGNTAESEQREPSSTASVGTSCDPRQRPRGRFGPDAPCMRVGATGSGTIIRQRLDRPGQGPRFDRMSWRRGAFGVGGGSGTKEFLDQQQGIVHGREPDRQAAPVAVTAHPDLDARSESGGEVHQPRRLGPAVASRTRHTGHRDGHAARADAPGRPRPWSARPPR